MQENKDCQNADMWFRLICEFVDKAIVYTKVGRLTKVNILYSDLAFEVIRRHCRDGREVNERMLLLRKLNK